MQYLELPVVEQNAWLDDIHRRYPRLACWLGQLVDRSHTVTLLDESVRNLADETLDRIEVNAGPLEGGNRLGPWEVIKEVGHGGMGRVYRGTRADGAFEMDVAIKQIGRRRRGLAELLQRECRLLARLDHAAVTRLVDAGLDDHAGPFLVMEWVEGTDLEPWLNECDPPAAEGLELFERIAEAVSHAHQRLIVHGDIKPGNIRVRSDGSIKLMDFGVSRLLDTGDADAAGLRALTPAFAAPEQRVGEDITPTSDIWSLGALLHWMLTGQMLDHDAKRQPHNLPVPGRKRRTELSAILARATMTDPSRRYRTIAELIDDLRRFRRHEPVIAMPVSRSYEFRKFIRRNPILVGGIAATLAALVIGISTTTAMYFQAEQARQHAALQQAQAEARSLELTQVATFQEEQLGRISPAGMSDELRDVLLDQLDRDEQVPLEARLDELDLTGLVLRMLDNHLFAPTLTTIGERFHDQPLIEAQLQQSLASSMRRLGLLQQADEPQSRALQIRREQLGEAHSDTRESVSATIELAWLQGHADRAMTLAEEALDRRLDLLGEHHPDTLKVQSDIGSMLHQTGRLEEAVERLEAVLITRREVHGENAVETVIARNNLASAYTELGQLEQAEMLQKEIIRGFGKLFGENHINTAIAHNNLAMTLRSRGELDEALTHQRQALAIVRHAAGEEHLEALQSMNNIGLILMEMARHDEAEDYFNRALDGQTRTLGPTHRNTLRTLHNLAVNARRMGRSERAVELARRAWEGSMQTNGSAHPSTLAYRHNLASSVLAAGDIEAAANETMDLLGQALEAKGADHVRTALIRNTMARALIRSGRTEEALSQAEKAHTVLANQAHDQDSAMQSVDRTMVEIHEYLAASEPDG